ncbi:MAG: hypothetical protein ACD_45C00683G0003 [uncultured bacterium]|nr:MAG: hypothetical protein ACD_45C00683G0003 [uncultured bacterium]
MNKRIPFILGLILLVTAIWLQVTSIKPIEHIIDRLENLVYDMQLRTDLFVYKKIDTPAVIIDIDDKSLKKEGRWPWSRAKLATLIGYLQKEGVAVVALDIIFPEKETNIATTVLQQLSKEKLTNTTTEFALKKIAPYFENDKKFANSIAYIDTVLGMSFLPQTIIHGTLVPATLELTSAKEKQLGFINASGVIGNIALLQSAAKGAGFINIFPDEDGVIRRVPILIRYQDQLYPSLALEAVRLYLLSNISLVTEEYGDQMRLEGVKLADRFIPTDEKGRMIIPFRGKSFTFPYYSATDILNKKIPPGVLTGKIAFIGTSATGFGELKPTAVENVFPGVEIQATIADSILANHFYYRPAWTLGAEIVATFLLGITFIFVFPYLGPRALAFFIILIPILFIFANNWLREKTGLIIYIFIPMTFMIVLAIINLIYGHLFEVRKRQQLKEMFGQYVPEKHIDTMLTSKGNYGLYGEDREMTVLFADIRNFTTLAEYLPAAQVKELLSDFFTPMTEIIFKHRGTIDKYVGDMVMAFWGAPLIDNQHTQHAISAALDMQNKVEKLKPIFAKKGWTDMKVGIGLNSGIMSVGDMGSKFRRSYTVIGDAVNLASRVENLTKYYNVNIVATHSIEAQQKMFVFRKLDRVTVKGKKTGTEIYEVVCKTEELAPEKRDEIALHHSALELYFNQEWEKSQAVFTELHQAHPHVKLYSLYLHRIADFLQTPPSSNWDGIYVHAYVS